MSTTVYTASVVEVRSSATFNKWLQGLRDRRARMKILARIDRLKVGNPGDTRSVGDGVQEMRIDFGPGYRVYYVWQGKKLVLLLCGGDKGSQDADIKRAKDMAAEL
jgi:putative addiction module killer protein